MTRNGSPGDTCHCNKIFYRTRRSFRLTIRATDADTTKREQQLDRSSLLMRAVSKALTRSAGSNLVTALRVLSVSSMVSGLLGCGTSPVLQQMSGDLIHLGSTQMDSLSCGHNLTTYTVQAQLTCQKNGYKTAKIRHSRYSKNEACLGQIVEATYRCEETNSF